MTGGILDSHHHLWDTRAVDYELFRSLPELAPAYTAADYDEHAASLGIERSICVEAASAGADGRRETEWLLAEAARSALVAGVVAWAPLDEPGVLDAHLDWLLGVGGIRIVGVRRSFELEAADFPRRPEVAEGARAVGSRSLPVDLVLFSSSLAAVIALVDAAPDTRFVLDHAGKPRIREGIREPWAAELRELADRPNVVCKLSGLTTEADRAAWTADDLAPYLEHVLACFSADRLLYGSDWPVVDLADGHARWLQALEHVLGGADEKTRAAIFRDTATRTYLT